MNITNVTPQQLRRAADLQERIQALQKELNGILGAAPAPAAPAPKAAAKTAAAAKPKRRISAAGIARIRAAQKMRWAKVKAAEPAAKK
jgi:hypothetical protein